MSKFLNLDDDGIVQLTRRFLYPKQKPSRLKRVLLDRRALAEQYTELIKAGICSNRADVARHFGVSRAWVTKILRCDPIKMRGDTFGYGIIKR
jgi:hypothetical protein